MIFNVTPLLLRLWDSINEPVPPRERADQRRKSLPPNWSEMFEGKFIRSELDSRVNPPHLYRYFLPLKDKCNWGSCCEYWILRTLVLGSSLDRVEDPSINCLLRRFTCAELRSIIPAPGTIRDIEQHGIKPNRRRFTGGRVISYDLVRILERCPRTSSTWVGPRAVLAALKVCSEEIDQETGYYFCPDLRSSWKRHTCPLLHRQRFCKQKIAPFSLHFHRFGGLCPRRFRCAGNGDANQLCSAYCGE